MSEEEVPQEEEVVVREGKAGLVFLSFFILVLVGALVALPFFGDKGAIGEIIGKEEPITKTFGNFHPVVLHLPIGIVFLTLLMEVCGWISFGKYRPVTTFGLFFAIVTGAFACVTGYVSLKVGGRAGEAWDNHMWASIAFVGVLSLAFLSRIWGGEKGSRNPVYAILLFIAAGVMGFGAHIGGEEIHGKLIDPAILGGNDSCDDDDAPIAKAPEERLAYAEVVVPILDNRCYGCHAEDTKQRGDLSMDSWEALLKGGDSGPALVPGDVKKSYMMELIHLPDDDDDNMPPPKKPQMEEHEIAILEWWVASLPKSDVLEDKTMKEMNAPAEIIEAIGKMVSPEELAEMEAEAEKKKKAEEEKFKKEREALDKALGDLKQDEQLKNAINYISQDSSELEFTAVSLRQTMKDEHLEKLTSVANALTSLQIGSTSVTEAALEANLVKMSKLKKLNLSQTSITDQGLDAVSQLHELEWLNLYGTKVTDQGLLKLKELTKLKKLYLWGSGATPEGADALKKELPEVEIFFGIN